MAEAKQNTFIYLILVPILLGSSAPWWWEKVETMFAGSSAPTSYRVRVKTASHKNAGTDASAFYIKLHGDRGISPRFPLDLKNTDDRRVGAEDTYTFSVKSNLGEIKEIEIWSTGQKKGDDGWLFERAIVEDLSDNRKWVFTCNKWIQTDSNSNLEIIVGPNGQCD